MTTQEVLLGNAAIGRGLVEAGCRMVTAYPGTPSTEVLPAAARFGRELGLSLHTEWSVNEKAALEAAIAASWCGLRAATVMKQVGLNVASDALVSVAYTGVKGGLVLVVADDPGPHSSQTEQDTRLFSLFARVPVLDPASPQEALEMARYAFVLSERFELPVILRPTTRVCHGKQAVAFGTPEPPRGAARFERDPARWAATPRDRLELHRGLEQKLQRVREAFESAPFNRLHGPRERVLLGVLAGGVAAATALDLLAEWGLGDQVPLLQIGTTHPLPVWLVERFGQRCARVLVLEQPGDALERQLPERRRVLGRGDGTVPAEGELTHEVIEQILRAALRREGLPLPPPAADAELERQIAAFALPPRRPRLCPGCGHRSAFFAMRRAARGAILPGDIGCYTLGTNLRAVDTCLEMGASIGMAAGFDRAFRLDGKPRQVVATIGDSTFLASGIATLAGAVAAGSRFTLLVLDNDVTAMTGFQPTPASGGRVSIPALVRACGVQRVWEVDPYDTAALEELLRQAHEFNEAPDGGVAVIVARRPCSLHDPSWIEADPRPVEIDAACDGCGYCLAAFECPALIAVDGGARVAIDRRTCVDCGQCIPACYKGLIVARATG